MRNLIHTAIVLASIAAAKAKPDDHSIDKRSPSYECATEAQPVLQVAPVQPVQIAAPAPACGEPLQVAAPQPCQPQVQVQAVQPCTPPVQVQAVAPPVQVQAVPPPVQVQAVPPPVQVQAVQPCAQPVQVQAIQPVQVQAVQPCAPPPVQVAALTPQPLMAPPAPAVPYYYPPPDSGSGYNDGYNSNSNGGNPIAGVAGCILRHIACPFTFLANEAEKCDNNSPPPPPPPAYYPPPVPPPMYVPPPAPQPVYYQPAPLPPPPPQPQGQWVAAVVPVPGTQAALQPVPASLVPDYGLPNGYGAATC